MDQIVTIVVILVICALISGAIEVCPADRPIKRWMWTVVLLGTAAFFAWRFLA